MKHRLASSLRKTLAGALAIGVVHTGRASVRAEVYQRVDRYGVVHVAIVPGTRPRRRPVVHVVGRPAGSSVLPARRDVHDPHRHTRYEEQLREAAALYTLPVHFLRAVIRVESNFDPSVVSDKGAVGLMQIMPFNFASLGIVNAFDPRQNILGGAKLLRRLANELNGDLVLTLASYNAGLGAVQRYRGVPPFAETRGYVARVLRHYRAYRAGMALRRR